MYATIALSALAAAVFVMVAHAIATAARKRIVAPRRPWKLIELLVYIGFLATTALLGYTAIYAMAVEGAMHGWLLWGHLTAAGAFTVALALMALLWAEAALFRPNDDLAATRPRRFTTLGKAMFWAILLAGAVAMATILVNMWAFLGTTNQDRTIAVHRYAGLVLVVAAVLHLYSLFAARLGRR